MTVFGQPPFPFFDPQQSFYQQPFPLLDAPIILLTFLLGLSGHFSEFGILLSQRMRFFFGHVRSVPVLSSPFRGDLSSSKESSLLVIFYVGK
jgi:hypothetical protein